MALTHQVTALQAATDAVTAEMELGATEGELWIYTSGLALELVKFTQLPNPNFDPAEISGTAFLANPGIVTSVALASGEAAEFVWQRSSEDATEVFRGTVTAAGGGGDLEIQGNGNAQIAAGQRVSINPAAITYTAVTP